MEGVISFSFKNKSKQKRRNARWWKALILLPVFSLSFSYSPIDSFDAESRLGTIPVSYASSIKETQNQALDKMNRESGGFDRLGDSEKMDFEKIKDNFEQETQKNNIDAEKNKIEMEERFNKMKQEFDKAGAKQNDAMNGNSGLSGTFGNFGNFDVNTDANNAKLNSEYNNMQKAIDSSSGKFNEQFNQSQFGGKDKVRGNTSSSGNDGVHQNSRGSLNLDNEDKERINNYYNGNGTVAEGSNPDAVDIEKVKNLHLSDNDPQNGAVSLNVEPASEGSFFSGWFPTTKEELQDKRNYAKFILLCIVLFIIMAILYFNGKRKG